MFKVVKTLEHGVNTYTEIPENWEYENKLRWPIISSRDKNADKKLLKLKFNSALPEETWETINCEVKGYFANFQLARDAAIAYSKINTEDEIR